MPNDEQDYEPEPPDDWEPYEDVDDDRWKAWRESWPIEAIGPADSCPDPDGEWRLARLITSQIRRANAEADGAPLFLSWVPTDEFEAKGVYYHLLEAALRHADASGYPEVVAAIQRLHHREPRCGWDSALDAESEPWRDLFDALRGRTHVTAGVRATITPPAIVGDLIRAARLVRAIVDPPDDAARRLAELTDTQIAVRRRGAPEWEATARAARHVAAYEAATRVWDRVQPDPREPSQHDTSPVLPGAARRTCSPAVRRARPGPRPRRRRAHRRSRATARSPDDAEPEPPGVELGGGPRFPRVASRRAVRRSDLSMQGATQPLAQVATQRDVAVRRRVESRLVTYDRAVQLALVLLTALMVYLMIFQPARPSVLILLPCPPVRSAPPATASSFVMRALEGTEAIQRRACDSPEPGSHSALARP